MTFINKDQLSYYLGLGGWGTAFGNIALSPSTLTAIVLNAKNVNPLTAGITTFGTQLAVFMGTDRLGKGQTEKYNFLSSAIFFATLSLPSAATAAISSALKVSPLAEAALLFAVNSGMGTIGMKILSDGLSNCVRRL
jgi:hypothetical protein